MYVLKQVFGLREFVVGDAAVCKNQQFQAVSVTAERWVPMRQVSEAELPAYLQQKRAEGYTLYGVEQTTGSVMLQDVHFARKALLVMGKEQQGLSAELIALLDCCIEIPQLGIVRSLNVHVTASIVAWEYTKQHALCSTPPQPQQP